MYVVVRECMTLPSLTVASTLVQGWGYEPCEPTVRLPDWSELVASYSQMKSAWGWANGGQPILVCYIRKYVIILGDIPLDVPPTKILGDVSPASPAGLTPVFAKAVSCLPNSSKWTTMFTKCFKSQWFVLTLDSSNDPCSSSSCDDVCIKQGSSSVTCTCNSYKNRRALNNDCQGKALFTDKLLSK